MSKTELLNKIKIELNKETKYLDMLKHNNSIYALKYFCLVFILYFSITLVDKYIINFLLLDSNFVVVYLFIAVVILVILCRIGYFENKLIYRLVEENKCITLNEFYELVLSKQSKLDGDL